MAISPKRPKNPTGTAMPKVKRTRLKIWFSDETLNMFRDIQSMSDEDSDGEVLHTAVLHHCAMLRTQDEGKLYIQKKGAMNLEPFHFPENAAEDPATRSQQAVITLSERFLDIFDEIKARTNAQSDSDVIRNALQVYIWFADAYMAGSRLFTQRPDQAPDQAELVPVPFFEPAIDDDDAPLNSRIKASAGPTIH